MAEILSISNVIFFLVYTKTRYNKFHALRPYSNLIQNGKVILKIVNVKIFAKCSGNHPRQSEILTCNFTKIVFRCRYLPGDLRKISRASTFQKTSGQLISDKIGKISLL